MKTTLFKISLCLCFLSIYSVTSCYSQEDAKEAINLYDKNGKKDGLWIEEESDIRTEMYYKHGVLNGICKSFSHNKMYVIFEYVNGRPSGKWCFFGYYGHIDMAATDFKSLTGDYTFNDGQKYSKGMYMCHLVNYHYNGRKKSEGILLWVDDIQMDSSREYGEWKYYDESGKLTHTKFYK